MNQARQARQARHSCFVAERLIVVSSLCDGYRTSRSWPIKQHMTTNHFRKCRGAHLIKSGTHWFSTPTLFKYRTTPRCPFELDLIPHRRDSGNINED